MAAAHQGVQGGESIWGLAKASRCREKPNELTVFEIFEIPLYKIDKLPYM